MSGRHSTLEYNLSLLQDLIRRDPESYREEFAEQYRHFEHTLSVFRLQPSLDPTSSAPRLLELISFHSHVAHCYPNETRRLSEELTNLLSPISNADVLHPQLRLGAAKALALLRNKQQQLVGPSDDPLATFRLFFDLSKCRDKELRKFLFTSTVQFVKSINTPSSAKKKKKKTKRGNTNGRIDAKLNTKLQSYVLSLLQQHQQQQSSSKSMARMALLLSIDLYRRRIWSDAKTVNAIALGGCLSPVTKLSATATKFFLGKDLDDDGRENCSDDDEDDADQEADPTRKSLKEVMVGYKAGKKTRARKKAMERDRRNATTTMKKSKSKSSKTSSNEAASSALRLLHDPQEFAERLYRKLTTTSSQNHRNTTGERFEFRLLITALLARVIGVHKSQVLPFYTYLLRFLQPRQRDVTKLLLFAAQSSHDLVPPDVVQPMIRTIVDRFVTDRNSPEAVTVGLNACREILANCPLAADEDLLGDLTQYKSYKNKNVSMAARGLIQLFRRLNPTMLHKRDRGRPTEADREHKPARWFGEMRAAAGIAGAECLLRMDKEKEEDMDMDMDMDKDQDQDKDQDEDQDEDEDEDWADYVTDDSDEEESSGGEDESESGDSGSDSEAATQKSQTKNDNDCASEKQQKATPEIPAADNAVLLEPNGGPPRALDQVEAEPEPESEDPARAISCSRIFTQQEFRRIAKHQMAKRLEPYRKNKKRPLEVEADTDHGEAAASASKKNKTRTTDKKKKNDRNDKEDKDEEEDEEEDEDEDEDEDQRGDLVRLADIEHLHKRPKMDRLARLECVRAGQEGREKFGRPQPKGPHVGRTNKKLAKNKPFSMVRRKEAKKMKKRSFREKQQALRRYLVNQKKMR